MSDGQRESIIPKWADDLAGRVITTFSRGDNAYIDRALLHGAIAAALVQERERAAKVVETANEHYATMHEAAKLTRDKVKAHDLQSMRIATSGLASIIRGDA